MLQRLVIENYKSYEKFDLELNEDLNIIVGDNEAGKSTILEAINLVLTARLNGKQIINELSPYLFSKSCITKYIADLRSGDNPQLPRIVLELYVDPAGFENLQGTNNSRKEDASGLRLEIVFDDDYKEDYEKLIEDTSKVSTVPIEYYKVRWLSFADGTITPRNAPIEASYIDASTIRLQNGTDYYLQNIINSSLDVKERVALSIAYRGLREDFGRHDVIASINDKLTKSKGAITDKKMAVTIDNSGRTGWESNLQPYIDDLPFQQIGNGEQHAIKILMALERKGSSSVVLVEEPENHLSFSSMNKLIDKIRDKCQGRQIILATHSAYVLNKLGMDKLILLANGEWTALNKLPGDTQAYFKKLPGYDTLRLVLAKKAILVEGPSDELIIQKAYLSLHHKLPIESGIDVINVRGLSFARFLDIAQQIGTNVILVTDNDGDYQGKVVDRYSAYAASANISIQADSDNDYPTLEPQLIKANDVKPLNKILGTSHADYDSLLNYMTNNKTEAALKIFESSEPINFPQYILNAVQ